MESWKFRRLVFVVFFILIPFSMLFHYPPIGGEKARIMRVSGAILTLSSSIFALYVHSLFPKTHDRPSDFTRLMEDGPYRYVRHPFYSAFIVMGFGIALWFLSVPGLLAYAFMIPLWERLAGLEENELIEHWGDEYREFMKTRGRFFPRPGVKR